MLGAWEVLLLVIMILAFLFPFRPIFKRNYKDILSFGVGLIVGRIFYFYLCRFLSFDSTFIKLIVVLVFGTLFRDAYRDIVYKASQK